MKLKIYTKNNIKHDKRERETIKCNQMENVKWKTLGMKMSQIMEDDDHKSLIHFPNVTSSWKQVKKEVGKIFKDKSTLKFDL